LDVPSSDVPSLDVPSLGVQSLEFFKSYAADNRDNFLAKNALWRVGRTLAKNLHIILV
jgi:hypothetical protein